MAPLVGGSLLRRFGRPERESTMRALGVVGLDVAAQHDSRWRRPRIRSQSRHSVRTVRTNRSAWAFACGARTGVGTTWMSSLRNTSSKAAAELAVSIVDQEPHPLEDTGEAEVAGLLGDPGAGRVRRAAREVDAAAFEFDEEQDVEAAERERLNSEEIAGEHARRLPAKKHADQLVPAAPRRRRRGRGGKSRRTVLGERRKPSLSNSPAIR